MKTALVVLALSLSAFAQVPISLGNSTAYNQFGSICALSCLNGNGVFNIVGNQFVATFDLPNNPGAIAFTGNIVSMATSFGLAPGNCRECHITDYRISLNFINPALAAIGLDPRVHYSGIWQTHQVTRTNLPGFALGFVSATPEPASALLIIGGLAVLGLRRRRQHAL